jgi:hypothetical protein
VQPRATGSRTRGSARVADLIRRRPAVALATTVSTAGDGHRINTTISGVGVNAQPNIDTARNAINTDQAGISERLVSGPMNTIWMMIDGTPL